MASQYLLALSGPNAADCSTSIDLSGMPHTIATGSYVRSVVYLLKALFYVL